ncbi:hypothetical protein CYLTODRAFT_488353 [Cylindrobasidium torrendii FP15055 ss-10]|uniref:F-box domain-containing protein n=1 Tax=Cylindrobasidium torrendii FP15055 ss-10 TaxID=1314674 RepID=A0A0D7BIL9_9AGAR|nr:hypothetical protein CYLTODRAFT_488353 [Cylindrobasidium torrendii FP15055 ss-10]
MASSSKVCFIDQLPDTALRAIFLRCLPDFETKVIIGIPSGRWCTERESLKYKRKSAPWSLLSVSKRWNTIATDSGELWSNLVLDTEAYARYSVKSIRGRVKAYLLRSKDAPLFIVTRFMGDFPYNKSVAIFDALLQDSARWKRFYFGGAITRLKAFEGRTFSSLQEVRLFVLPAGADTDDGNEDSKSSAPVPVLTWFQNSPLSTFYHTQQGAAFTLPAKSLTTYVASDCDLSPLDYLENLKELHIRFLETSEDAFVDRKARTLSGLRKIELHEMMDSGGIYAFFGKYQTPDLEHLRLSYSSERRSAFPRLGHLPGLKNLALSITDPDAEKQSRYVLPFLRSLPHIEELFLGGLATTKRMLKTLAVHTPGAEEGNVLKNLRILRFGMHGFGIHFGDIVAVAVTRCKKWMEYSKRMQYTAIKEIHIVNEGLDESMWEEMKGTFPRVLGWENFHTSVKAVFQEETEFYDELFEDRAGYRGGDSDAEDTKKLYELLNRRNGV